MPTLDWLRNEFHYGYSSGDIISDKPDPERKKEELKIGGSYKAVLDSVVRPFVKPHYNVLELGPGKGSWSRAIIDLLSREASFTTIDFQDVSKWIEPQGQTVPIVHYMVESIDYKILKSDYYDFFFSFGVLCHNNIGNIYKILQESYPKLRRGAILVHQYSDWDKLDKYGWEKGRIPLEFQNQPDSEIWWSRNNAKTMKMVLESIGYLVLSIDADIVQRDGIFIAQKPFR